MRRGGHRLLPCPGTEAGKCRDGDGYISAALVWVVLCVFGAAPYKFSGAIPRYLDALFEAASGLTTTGATLLTNVEALPRGILFWRSLTQ